MKRNCPSCAQNSIPVSELILSDTHCPRCRNRVGVQGFFRAVFFLVTLAATVAVGVIVLAAQGLYAALLMVSVPVGAIGFIKARFCPLVVRDKDPMTEDSFRQGS